MSVSMEKPERRMSVLEKNYSYTLGGVAQYLDEIQILNRNGYDHTAHDVLDRDGQPLWIAVLHRGNDVVKVYEL